MNTPETVDARMTAPNKHATLAEWLYFLEHRYKQEMQFRLANPAQAADRMQVLKWSIPVITVGGTNGKGSTVAALSAIYQAAGYRVGQFISPHLLRFNERICINQEPITDQRLCELFARVEHERGEIELTYFEMSLLAALIYFKEASIEVLILEVGLGGRLDATNIIDADLAIVSTVDLDHQDILGPDKESIGKEKAGIFRSKQPCIYADFSPPLSLLDYAHKLEANLYCLGRDYHYQILNNQLHIQSSLSPETLTLPVPRLHIHAAVSAVLASMCLQKVLPVSLNDWMLSMSTMRIMGRQQWIPGSVSFLYDVAHNPQAAEALAHCLKNKLSCANSTKTKRIHAVFSALKDKDIYGLIRPLSSIVDQWYPARLSCQRAATPEHLIETFDKVLSKQVPCFDSPKQAMQAAMASAESGDWIIIFGSFWLVGEIMNEYHSNVDRLASEESTFFI